MIEMHPSVPRRANPESPNLSVMEILFIRDRTYSLLCRMKIFMEIILPSVPRRLARPDKLNSFLTDSRFLVMHSYPNLHVKFCHVNNIYSNFIAIMVLCIYWYWLFIDYMPTKKPVFADRFTLWWFYFQWIFNQG